MNKGNITLEKTSDLKLSDLKRIYSIEKDMWARGIGEYVKCNECNSVYSKDNIFGELEKDIRLKTVCEIEKITTPLCLNCSSKTDYIYGTDYFSEIIDRYSKEISKLVVYRDENGVIRGFMDGYIDTFEKIYNDEFKFHFNEDARSEIKKRFGLNDNSNVLTVSSIGTDEENLSLFITFNLIKEFFMSFDEEHIKLPGIIESIEGSTTYKLFKKFGADIMGINKESNRFIKKDSINSSYSTDILFQKNVISDYRKNIKKGLKGILSS